MPRALDAFANGFLVERRGRARVNQIAADAFLGERVNGFFRKGHHASNRNHGDMFAFAHQTGFAEWHNIGFFRHFALTRVQSLVFEKYHRVIVANRLNHQPLGVVGIRRNNNFQTRHGRDKRVHSLRVLRAHVHTSPHRGANNHRAGGLAAKHVTELRNLVVNLVEADAEEIGEHNFGDGPQPRQCGTARSTDDRRL